MNTTLRSLAENHNIFIGAAVNTHALENDTMYADILSREFNMVTAENVMKFEILMNGREYPFNSRPTRNPANYNFHDADKLVDFARKHDMKVRGHTLVWHNQLPQWVSCDGKTNDKNWDRKQLECILEEHIQNTAGRYKGSIYAWDVVNEAITEKKDTRFESRTVTLPGTSREVRLRNSIWLNVLGPDFLATAFCLAHQADPEALLFYNDFNAEGTCEKADDVYSLVRYLVDKGVPVHGIGMQMHVSLDDYPPPDEMAKNIQRFSDMGLEVHITELDVRINGTANEEKLYEQARIYGEIADVVLSNKSCRAIVTWGYTDKYSWIPYGFPGYDNGLLFDRDYQRKPACYSLIKALSK
ncbi:MAG: endo-1,4-beta-xylanase [Dehalococcoidales bacterium]|nr:endo-1,4-beta-xylanase [Dehalococcoidales bacterium]